MTIAHVQSEFFACVTGSDVFNKVIFLMELMLEHVSNNSQLVLVMSGSDMLFVVCAMVGPTFFSSFC